MLPSHDNVHASSITTIGRPRDTDLTQRLLVHAGDLMITCGLAAVTPDALARAASAGKASIYRRWPGGMTDLMVELLAGCTVVPLPNPGTSAPVQIHALLSNWMAPPTRNEQILVNALGVIGTDQKINRAIRARINDDLQIWWRSLTGTSLNCSQPSTRMELLVLRAMLIARLQTGPLGKEVIAYLHRRLIDGLPIVQ